MAWGSFARDPVGDDHEKSKLFKFGSSPCWNSTLINQLNRQIEKSTSCQQAIANDGKQFFFVCSIAFFSGLKFLHSFRVDLGKLFLSSFSMRQNFNRRFCGLIGFIWYNLDSPYHNWALLQTIKLSSYLYLSWWAWNVKLFVVIVLSSVFRTLYCCSLMLLTVDHGRYR